MEGIIVFFRKGGMGIGAFIIGFLVLFLVTRCDAISQEQERRELRGEPVVGLSDLNVYSGSGTDINLQAETGWIQKNAPDVDFGFGGIGTCYVSKNRETYDGAFPDAKYNKSFYSDYDIGNQNEASVVSRYLNEEFSTFNAVLFLRKDDVIQWKDSEYCDMQGYCFIFGDDRLLYQSPVLTPENPSTQFIELDVSSVKELVVIIVGSAHMCNAYVTR